MEALTSRARTGRVDHEAIWGPIGALALLAARFFPFDRLPLGACPFHALTGLPCFSCGGTRSFMALTRLDLLDAIALNPMAVALAAFTAVYTVHALGVWLAGWRRWGFTVPSPAFRRAIRIAVVAALALNWAWLILDGR